jgi:hypothetical protein
VRRALAASLFLLASGFVQAAWTVDELFASLAREKPGRAAFEEKKYLALLDKPVTSSGELVFTPPARLERRTQRPRVETVIVDADVLTLERDGKRRTFAIADYPAIGDLIESIRATLAGDLPALTRNYSIGLEGAEAKWRLVLRPLERQAPPLVSRVEIAGSGARVQSVEIFQADGDRSVMTITPLR